MADPFSSLVQAIVEDDGAEVKKLLKHDASMATACAARAQLEPDSKFRVALFLGKRLNGEA
jgi:hypothetical protein